MKARRLCTILVGIMCCVLLGACSKQSDVYDETMKSQISSEENISMPVDEEKYSLRYFSSNRLSLVMSSITTKEAVYLWGCNFLNDQESDWVIGFNKDESTSEYQLQCSDEGYVVAIDATTNSVYYLERIDLEDGTSNWILHNSDETIDLKWPTEMSNLRCFAVDGSVVYIADRNMVQVCDLSSGDVLYTINLNADITQFMRRSDGKIVAACEDTGEFMSIEGDGKKPTKLGDLPLELQNRPLVSGINSEYDYLVIGESALYGWNIGANNASQLLSFDTYGLVPNNISALSCVGNGVFIGATWRTGEEKDRLFWLTPVDDDQKIENEKKLRIAGLSRPMVMSAAISDFKALCPEYSVEYIDYAELYGDQALQRLQNDLLLGGAPDLLFVNGLPVEAYIDRGMLENLYEWIDKDSEVDRNEFTKNLMAVLEAHDDQLYKLPQSYSIVTTAGTQSLAGSKETWTYADINKMMEENDDLLSVFYGESKESLSVTLLLYMINSFVDYENAISHFDSTEMVEYLKFLYNIAPREQLDFLAENELDALRNGEVLFAQLMLTSPQMFAELDETYDELVYPGYPNAGGAFYLNLPMAIPIAAVEKEAAWKFMKMLFSSEYYSTRGGWLPLQASFDMSLKDACENGASKESMEQLAEIQEKLDIVTYYDEAVSSIILEETSYLFGGVQTAQETAAQIHDRVRLYLSEQYISQN